MHLSPTPEGVPQTNRHCRPFVCRCVSEHAFFKDVGANLASRTGVHPPKIPMMISRLQELIQQNEVRLLSQNVQMLSIAVESNSHRTARY